MGKRAELAKGIAVDAWGKLAHDQADITGLSAARVAKSLKNNVHPDVVALQINKGQERNNRNDPLVFTGDEMKTVAKFFEANRRRVAYTSIQAAQIDSNQEALESRLPRTCDALTA